MDVVEDAAGDATEERGAKVDPSSTAVRSSGSAEHGGNDPEPELAARTAAGDPGNLRLDPHQAHELE